MDNRITGQTDWNKDIPIGIHEMITAHAAIIRVIDIDLIATVTIITGILTIKITGIGMITGTIAEEMIAIEDIATGECWIYGSEFNP